MLGTHLFFSLLEVIGKILINFCVWACNLWISVRQRQAKSTLQCYALLNCYKSTMNFGGVQWHGYSVSVQTAAPYTAWVTLADSETGTQYQRASTQQSQWRLVNPVLSASPAPTQHSQWRLVTPVLSAIPAPTQQSQWRLVTTVLSASTAPLHES